MAHGPIFAQHFLNRGRRLHRGERESGNHWLAKLRTGTADQFFNEGSEPWRQRKVLIP